MKTIKVTLKVMPKPEVLDSAGRAVAEVLKKNKFNLHSCRVGKSIELEVEDTAHVKQDILKMAEYVLYNPLVEQIEILTPGDPS